MPEVHTDYKTRQPPVESASALAPLPPKTLRRRKRLIRYGGLVVFLLSAGLSAIPGAKTSSYTTITKSEPGVTTQVQQFSFTRAIGLPFTAGRADYNEDGTINAIKVEGPGLLGNFVVALGLVVVASIFLGRRRRDD